MKPQNGARGAELLTIEEFERLPDEPCHMELLRGRLIREPLGSLEHGMIAAHIGALLLRFVSEHRLGSVVVNCGFVLFEDPPTVRAPDAAFIREERHTFDPQGFVPFAPDLSVEVVTPANTMAGMLEKILDYLDAGARLVWVIDPGPRCVTVYRSRDHIRMIGENGELDGADVLPGFRLKVSELFEN